MTTYSYPINWFPNSKVNLDNLTNEINQSSISISLDHCDFQNDIVYIYFRADLGSKDKMTLDTIVATHDSTPKSSTVLDVNVIPMNKKYFEIGDGINDSYRAESWILDIPADTSVYIKDFSKAYNITLLAASLKTTQDMIGDTICALVAPNTPIGVITTNALTGDTSLNVNDTVIQNILVGRELSMDGITNHEVIEIDKINNVVTLDTPLEKDYNIGTYTLMNIHLIKEMYIHAEQDLEIGKSITTGQRVPKNTNIRIRYWNTTQTAKKIAFFVEYLY